jgi:hypothetical protein
MAAAGYYEVPVYRAHPDGGLVAHVQFYVV